MLQKEIDEMTHNELYRKVEDHKGDEILSAISLRLVQENRKYRKRAREAEAALKECQTKLDVATRAAWTDKGGE